MPEIKTLLCFKLLVSERKIAEEALAKFAGEIGGCLEGGRVSAKEAFMALCRVILETHPEGQSLGERRAREDSPYKVVFRTCLECFKSAMGTDAGPVEVRPEVVERIVGAAETVVIEPEEELQAEPESVRDKGPAASDGGEDAAGKTQREGGRKRRRRKPPPSSKSLRKRVILREGGFCANPSCERPAVHCHHVRPRAEGGPTALWNEVALCALCHAAVTAGFLEIEGSPLEGFRFRARAQGLEVSIAGEMQLLASLGVHLKEVPRSGRRNGSGTSGRPDTLGNRAATSGRPDSPGAHREGFDDLVRAMASLGWSRREARRRLPEAEEQLAAELNREPTDSELLHRALQRRP